MTAKQERFVAEYLKDLNATQAAIRSGFSEKTAAQAASRLLRNVEIAQAVQAGKSQQLQSADLSAARVLEEYRRLAFSDVREFFQADGTLKPMSEWSAEQGAQIASMEVIIKNAEAGDGKTDRVHKFRVWDKTKALTDLAKHFALLTEKVDLSGGIDLRWED